jgi:hypothetical protein
VLQAFGTIRFRFLQKRKKKFHACVPLRRAPALILCVDGAAAAQGGGGLPLLEGGQPAQLETLALPRADERATSSSGGLCQVRENL